ncbi:hypothetical protein K438DRAFT_1038584 [Mycena galopus ATCC 62051]|nr:hypothetical protein K438DRAFT_1038584 [Mycena galopus ATCC 62051]
MTSTGYASMVCLLQICLGIWTIFDFGFAAMGLPQLWLFFYIVLTLVQLYMLSTYKHRPTVSRVDNHIKSLGSLIVIWLFAPPGAILLLFKSGYDTVISSCAPVGFMNARCAPIAIDLALPLGNLAILLYVAARIAGRAREIHGEEMVAMVVQPPPVPAWMLGTVAETEGERVELAMGV